MNHSFQPNPNDKAKCNICLRAFIVHTSAATCDACPNIGPVELFGDAKDPKSMVLCKSCLDKEYNVAKKMSEKTEELARKIDDKITIVGDFFNAETISHVDVKKSIFADESFTEQQKIEKYQQFLLSRFEKFNAVVQQLDKKKFELVSKQQAIKKTLIELGNELKAEIREKIRASDSSYAPLNIPKPKADRTIAKKSPMDRVIEAYASMHGVSIEEAKKAIDKLRG